jgi:large subunit ribosomal protein L35
MSPLALLFLSLLASCQAFVLAPAGPSASAISQVALPLSPASPVMTSINKKAKAACRKAKSSRAAAKRFKVTSTGKLLRHYAGKAHLLRKKRPQKLASLRRTGQCDKAELATYQSLLLVKPKK